jgi:hypothetical protein
MDDSTAIYAQDLPASPAWVILIHAVPPKPDYFRVKVRRRLRKIGAIPLKNSVYVLPHTDDAVEDFVWLAQEITAEGGEATVVEANLVDPAEDAALRERYLKESLRGIAETLKAAGSERAEPGAQMKPAMSARTWVTRRGVKIDRISSAWLIRRFIDPAATFRFVDADAAVSPGELRFDMFSGEYTHEGDNCTFETLLERFHLQDPALRAIANVVHDLDFKDAKFGSYEAIGVGMLIGGIVLSTEDDNERIKRGAAMLEDLYAYFSGPRAPRRAAS